MLRFHLTESHILPHFLHSLPVHSDAVGSWVHLTESHIPPHFLHSLHVHSDATGSCVQCDRAEASLKAEHLLLGIESARLHVVWTGPISFLSVWHHLSFLRFQGHAIQDILMFCYQMKRNLIFLIKQEILFLESPIPSVCRGYLCPETHL